MAARGASDGSHEKARRGAGLKQGGRAARMRRPFRQDDYSFSK